MDYQQASIGFKVQKVMRYSRLYGLERTYAKVQGQRHTRRHYDELPQLTLKAIPGSVGLIGAGNYAFTTIAHYLERNAPGALRAVMDVDPHRCASLAVKYNAAYFTTDAQRLLDDPHIDLVYVASNHATHAEFASRALRAGKAVHVEKPHAVDSEQLDELVATMRATKRPLAIGYNRPESRLGTELRRHLAKQAGPGMYSWFVAGHELPADHWYYRPEEGGRVLGNMCHWIDFLYHLAPDGRRFPVTITPTVTDRSDCDVAVSYSFADGTIGIITFSAKGHAFEGVREYFSGHKGDALVSLQDFQRLVVDTGAKRYKFKERRRDHGHERRITRSFRMAKDPSLGDSPEYVQSTGNLMLATRRALESGESIVVVEP